MIRLGDAGEGAQVVAGVDAPIVAGARVDAVVCTDIVLDVGANVDVAVNGDVGYEGSEGREGGSGGRTS